MTANPPITPKYRIESIDILRGAVMLIMAIDHVRDFFHHGHPEPNDLEVTTPLLFFTRFITHFCAPTFVLLTGVSAYLAGTRRTGNQLSLFLIKRGLWLIMIELIVITFAITLNPFYSVLILQVIWAIGGSMVILGVLIALRASWQVIGFVGLLIFLGHNVFDVVRVHAVADTFWGRLLLTTSRGPAGFWPLGNGHRLAMAYALLPWTGVMLIGYAFGSLYKKGAEVIKRKKILLYSGLSLVVFFLVFRYFNIYGDPSPWSVQKTMASSIISFFNVTKYPCSLLYLSITLGPALIILSVTENISNKFTRILIVYGNVPFFYYLCHWYLIKALNIIVFYVAGFNNTQIVNPHRRNYFQPDDFGFSLFGVYVIWLVVILLLYFPCRWYGKYKSTHQQWWLSYL